MAWEENPRICLHMQLIAILSRTGVMYSLLSDFGDKNFCSVATIIADRQGEILNYFINRATNASAESLNAKIKHFRAQLHGVVDVKFFLFWLTNIYA